MNILSLDILSFIISEHLSILYFFSIQKRKPLFQRFFFIPVERRFVT